MTTELVATQGAALATAPSVADWDTVIAAFLDTLKAATTRATYGPTVRGLALELEGAGPADVTGAQLAGWAKGIRDQVQHGELSPNTGKRQVMTAKSFFAFAYATGQSRVGKDMRSYVLQPPAGEVVKPFQVLSVDEQARLLAALEGQDRQIVATLLYAGLRASELCRLSARDYYTDEAGRRWLQVQGKGGKGRTVPVGDRLAAELGTPPGGNGAPLFEGRQGRYSRVRVFQIVKAAVKRAGIDKRISPHSLRHTAAITWLRAGVPLPVVQQWLGHTSLATTQRYLDHLERGESHQYMP